MKILHIKEGDAPEKEISSVFSNEEYHVQSANSVVDAISAAEAESYDYIIYQNDESGANGLALLESLRSRNINTPVVLSSSTDLDEDVKRVFNRHDGAHIAHNENDLQQLLNDIFSDDFVRDPDLKLGQSRKLLESSALFRDIIDGIPLAVIMVDYGGRIAYSNNAAASILRYQSPERLVGSPAIKLFPLAYNSSGMGDVRTLLHKENSSWREFRWQLSLKGGEHINVESLGKSMSVDGKQVAVFLFKSIETEVHQENSNQEALTTIFCEGLMMRSGLNQILAGHRNCRIIDASASAAGRFDHNEADVIVYACSTLNEERIEDLNKLVKRANNKPILLATLTSQSRFAKEAIKLGINGIISNESDLALIPSASNRLKYGGSWFSNGLLQALVSEEKKEAEEKVRDKTLDDVNLTRREREVLGLLAQGMKNKDIANKLQLSYRTVVTHVYNIYRKLKITSRTEAIHFAITRKLIEI